MAVSANKLGRYELRREIARSNDVVYEAWDPAVNRRVALKEMVMPPGVGAAAADERVQRFYREARAAGGLSHPNIVTIYEVGEDMGRHFIAMEYLEGPTLRESLQGGQPFPVDRAVLIAAQIADALQYAHSHGVIHRDVKPDNVHLVTPTVPKLTDFGIARIQAETNITLSGQVFGTPSYMSPEQVAGGEIDARTDVFSLGVMLFEMAVGRKPFTGESVVTITYNIVNETPLIPPTIPDYLAAIIRKALHKRPQDRYATAGEMAEDLRAHRAPNGAAASAPGPGSWAPAQGQGTTYMPGSQPAGAFIIPTPRRSFEWPKLPRLSDEARVFMAALAATLALGALIAWGIWASSQEFRQQRTAEAMASVDALRRPGIAAYNNGDYGRAVDLFVRVYSATHDPRDRANLVNAYIEFGLSQSGDNTLRLLNAAYQLDPANPRTLIYLGSYYDTAGDKGTALRWYNAGLAAMSDRPEDVTQQMRSNLAVIYVNLGDYANRSGPINGQTSQDLWRTAQRIDSIGPAGAAAAQRLGTQ
ncbi:MAG TPA: serine/threonine-protein kinase [Armatimonadota bacterium]|jgi:serine/threonine-protein kinase